MMCGHTTPEVEARWGDYGDMAEVLLKDPSKDERWVKFCVCDDQFPSEADLLSFQGIVITGSKHDAFADDPWIVKLRQYMRQEADRGQRILGICFGAQLLAVSLGGKAGRADCGWESGSRPMELLPAFFQQPYAAALPNKWTLNVHETHRDQVLEMPPGAELLATSEQTPLEIWRLEKNVLAVQGHPEFTVSFQHALNEYRVANGSMTESEKRLAEEDMLKYPVTEKNAQELAMVLQLFLKGPL